MKTAFSRLVLSALLLLAVPAAAGLYGSYQPRHETDLPRMQDLVILAGHIEDYYKKTGHYPLVGDPSPAMAVVALTDYVGTSGPPSLTWKMLEAELQKELGPQVKLSLDPSEGRQGEELRVYQYASDGQDYYVSAELVKPVPYAKQLSENHYKMEITSRTALRDEQYTLPQIRHFVKYGPDEFSRQMALSIALATKDYKTAKEALVDGANPNPACEFQTRCLPLADAAQNGDIDTMNFLIDNGADVNATTAYDDVPLISAMGKNQTAAIRLLLDKGANVNISNAFGITPFMGALSSGDLELSKLMLEKGGNVHRNYLLLNSEAKPGEMGDYPLESAISSKKPEIVELVLKAGADASKPGHAGAAMLDLAQVTGSPKIVELIKAALKK